MKNIWVVLVAKSSRFGFSIPDEYPDFPQPKKKRQIEAESILIRLCCYFSGLGSIIPIETSAAFWRILLSMKLQIKFHEIRVGKNFPIEYCRDNSSGLCSTACDTAWHPNQKSCKILHLI